jgi:hypothetical protein
MRMSMEHGAWSKRKCRGMYSCCTSCTHREGHCDVDVPSTGRQHRGFRRLFVILAIVVAVGTIRLARTAEERQQAPQLALSVRAHEGEAPQSTSRITVTSTGGVTRGCGHHKHCH